MKRLFLSLVYCSLVSQLSMAWGQDDKSADRNALPQVPDGFEVTLFASDPLVRQPCSMVFDERGRLFVGMGPQYRNPTPETPGDSVVIVQDSDGDGQADRTTVFATGFNAIQGLAWHGRDLWVANAPDLTVVRDLDDDDEADEYIKVYTDLGNLEHGLHGLNWAPDGKLYMSKGNSKGLNQPGRYAPKPFRELWGIESPPGVPDFPAPETFRKDEYRHAYHDPADDWGLDGGVLRCDDGGHNLEIVARGFRNPWDIVHDSGFNWIGTDNDQTTGDRVFMPFYGAHFGWNHSWSSHWSVDPHAPTAPVSGPLFEGSGTGVAFCQSPQFPEAYRGVFFVNDWLQKMTWLWRPQWDGAVMRPEGGRFTPFIEGGSSLFRPTDMEFGPDGALWILGWSSGYGAEWQDGELTNEGRIYRVACKNAPPANEPEVVDFTRSPAGKGNSGESHYGRLDAFSINELIDEFESLLPVRRINAQDEMVRRGDVVRPKLLMRLSHGTLTENQETWTAWALGRMPDNSLQFSELLEHTLQPESKATLNLKIQAVRILAYRKQHFAQRDHLAETVALAIEHPEPRLRFAAVQAIHETHLKSLAPALLALLQDESDAAIRYAGWQALRSLSSLEELRQLLTDSRAGVRRAALLGLLETHAATQPEVQSMASHDPDPELRQIAELWLSKNADSSEPAIRGRSLQVASANMANVGDRVSIAAVRQLKTRGNTEYKAIPGGVLPGALAYLDRGYRLSVVPPELAGCDLIQTANDDDGSQGSQWLNAEALAPVDVWVGLDTRQKEAPEWLRSEFQKTDLTAAIDEGTTFRFYTRSFPAGPFELGGNTDDGRAGGKGNYLVVVAPQLLSPLEAKSTLDDSLALIEHGDLARGELLFRHAKGAGCFKCHSLDQAKNGFGPNLSSIGLRSNARHVAQSIVAPSAVITEGFNQLTVVVDSGHVHSGVLLEESGLTLSLGQSTGERLDIRKTSIEERKSNAISAMPDLAGTLTPQQVADLTTYLLSMRAGVATTADPNPNDSGFSVDEKTDRLAISLDGHPIVDFVFRDDRILRPYFANARLSNGPQVTRSHPPIEGVDAVDHDTMHPGIWLGFGDISGQDYWRNKAAIEHVKFVLPPTINERALRFATECVMKTDKGEPLCRLTNRFTMTARPNGWLLIWSAEFHADNQDLSFGDQEEMGFGARVATPFTEKNGGVIRSSVGKTTANETWGQAAAWCDYSGTIGDRSGGITLMASPANFRESWWHNRDYGVFVANPFGREAMKQGARSSVIVSRGKSLQMTFGALVHDHRDIDLNTEFTAFQQLLKDGPTSAVE